ncbi:MAG: AMP-binding protein [Acidimicrobiales bacterium]
MDQPVTSSTLWELVEQAAARWPDAPMLVSRQGDGCTFAQYRERAEVMAAGLADLGVGEGDVVSWILPTWVDTVVLAAALARLGAVQNPIIGIYRDREVGICCEQTGVPLLIHPGEFGNYDFGGLADRVAARTNGGLTPFVLGPASSPRGSGHARAGTARSGGGALADLHLRHHRRSEGARHTDHTVGSFPAAMSARLDVQHGDRYALVFPFPHIGGIGLLYMALQTGCTHLLDEAVDPVETIRFLSEHGCTHRSPACPST